MLKEKILKREPGIITYGITPPKQNNTEEKIKEITQKHIERLKNLKIDGLIIYDIQEEEERTKEERVFTYLPTIDSEIYSREYLNELNIPKIVYRCVGKYSEEQLKEWLRSEKQEDRYSVFVGSSSRKQQVTMKLNDAYELKKRTESNILLGGITIPERHMKYNDEHLRLINKADQGCNYFVSQVVYNIEAAKNLLSDYYYYCKQKETQMVPILFTLTPCGSIKTLEFMKWLGIHIPRWLEKDLQNAEDILDKSMVLLKKQMQELMEYAMEKKIPIGCNIESVSIRKVEIDASIQLVDEIRAIFEKLNK